MTCKGNILSHKLIISIGVNKLLNMKFYALFTASTVLVTALFLAPVISSLATNVTISNTGQISTTKVWARSGSAEDIQAAVDAVAAAGGGTVYIPSGNWTFNPSSWPGVTIPNGVNIIGAGIGQTVLSLPNYPQGGLPQKPFPNRPFFYCVGNRENDKKVRVGGITFQGYAEDEEEVLCGVEVVAIDNFRIDHCEFIDFSQTAIFIRNCRGVIDHCIIDNPYKDRIAGTVWAYGIIVLGDYTAWYSLDQLLGKYTLNTVYIEDCIFSRCRHSIASNQAGWYVVRYCTFKETRPINYPMIDVHGASPGGRGLEAYNNTIIGSLYGGSLISVGVDFRGGGGVVFNNKFIDCAYGVKLSVEAPEPYQPYNIWIWNNQMVKQNAPNEGTLLLNTGDYKEGVDYFLYAKPDYTPYPYPHPLTLS